MNFTKEEIETAKKILESYRVVQNRHHCFENYLDSLLKSQRKKIIVQVEANIGNFDINWLATALEGYCHSAKFVITDLPEVFTRQDVVGILTLNVTRGSHFQGWNALIDKWLSERKSK